MGSLIWFSGMPASSPMAVRSPYLCSCPLDAVRLHRIRRVGSAKRTHLTVEGSG